ncbi:S1 family peptidase [Mastigocladopsis repens]|uniref:S1 family peptidase n=1 Tax=Mastigocladopsis repens TaxID=221287 RepID=UPI0002FF6CEF|nr:serine protease [Mastigocladopsis repens]
MTWRWQRLRLSSNLLLVTCLSGIAISLLRQVTVSVSCNYLDPNLAKVSQPTNQLSAQQVQQLAEAITVKVLSNELLGSGTLIKREGQVYSVITNAHVIRAANPPYQIQTPDGRIYPATLSNAVFQDNDLALLEFRSTNAIYTVATVGDSATLTVGDKVFIGGFTSNAAAAPVPSQLEPSQDLSGESPHSGFSAQRSDSSTEVPSAGEKLLTPPPAANSGVTKEFLFTTGQVSLVLDKALEGGYQIGYTNDIRKGMSGAPLLNHQGEMVGINGLHKDPLWDTPDLYHDGSEPCKPLQDLITRSSLAVPIKTVVELAP